MTKKITFIGKGNAGVFGALHFATYSDAEVELIYDPKIPAEKVGQATVLEAPNLLWRSLGLNWYDNPIEATPKFGVVYEGWGKKKDSFIHPFNFGATAVHYSPNKLQDYIINSGKFKVTEGNAEPKDIDSDFIFDCRGKLANENTEYMTLKNPLNAVLLKQLNHREPNINWTRCVATPDGWTFVIPNTNNTTSHGYLYNQDITSKDNAIKNFKKQFKFDGEVEGFSFKQYLAKEPIKDNVILSGNRLFFLEPLEATAVQTYLTWYRLCYDYIFLDGEKEKIVNKLKTHVQALENFILWHYQFGSKYKTKFWKEAAKYKIDCATFNAIVDYCLVNSFDHLRNEDIAINKAYYGQFAPINFKYWLDNVK